MDIKTVESGENPYGTALNAIEGCYTPSKAVVPQISSRGAVAGLWCLVYGSLRLADEDFRLACCSYNRRQGRLGCRDRRQIQAPDKASAGTLALQIRLRPGS